MDPSDIPVPAFVVACCGLAVGILGLSWAVGTSLRLRQWSRPRLVLHVGLDLDRAPLPRKFRTCRKRTILFGAPADRNTEYLGLPFVLENTGKVSARDVTLQLFYPKECLVETAVVVDAKRESAYVIETQSCSHREVYALGDFVQVSLTFPVVRPGEKLASFEFLKFDRVAGNALRRNPLQEFDAAVVAARYLTPTGVLGFNVVRMTLMSSDRPPASEDVNLFRVRASTPEELGKKFLEFGARLWDGKRPPPGVYVRNPLRKPSRWVTELAELVLPGETPPDQTLSGDAVVGADRTLGYFEVPPWGFFGESYDIVREDGLRNISAAARGATPSNDGGSR